MTKYIAIGIFLIMYILMIVLPKRRAIVALSAAALMVICQILPLGKVLPAIDWNVLMMIFGNVMWVTILMSLFSGIISAFIDNVATVLMVAPVGLAICKKLKINPVPMIICIAVSSNLQGAATLVGDTTSIMLAAADHMNFNDFFYMNGKPGMFFAVELGAILTIPLMMVMFRKNREPVNSTEHTKVTDYVPTITMLGHVVLLIIASFIPNTHEWTNGIICMVCGILTIIWELIKQKSTKGMVHSLKALDWDTMLLLSGLFVVIASIKEVGIINDLANLIANFGGSNRFVLFSIIVWGSVVISAFIDNIPYVATMLPLLAGVATAMNVEPHFLYFGLLVGATLGGNLTPIGASANIAGVGMLRKEGHEVSLGHEVSFGDFMKIGIPFTLTAVIAGYLFVWIVWAPK